MDTGRRGHLLSVPGVGRNQPQNGARAFAAPGRVNIIGEHTDYNDGYVLPTNTALFTEVIATARTDRKISARSSLFDEMIEFDIDNVAAHLPAWGSYIAGVATVSRRNGVEIAGTHLEISGEIPIGGGLSSSASLELAVGKALFGIAGADVDAATLAHWCRAAEQEFAGVDCGIMDQYSVACGRQGHAMLLDCRSLESSFAAIPATIALLVVDSGVKHALPDSGYNDRAKECREAVAILRAGGNEIESLRDADPGTLAAARDKLGDTLFRRARHVVTENQRTLDAFAALRSEDIGRLGQLVSESHRSLRDDYEVSGNEIDELVALTEAQPGVLGARMVGGGFGGCVLAIVDAGRVSDVADQVVAAYETPTGTPPWTHIVSPARAAREVTRS